LRKQDRSQVPIIVDADRAIRTAYGMIDAGTSDEQPRPDYSKRSYHQPRKQAYAVLNYPRLVSDVIWTKSSAASRLCSYPTRSPLPLRPTGPTTTRIFPWRTVLARPRSGSVFLLLTVSEDEAKERWIP
jgi:hypothetical protein